MTPVGNRLELPADDHFANYAAVKKCLLTAGGKYKKCGFEFTDSAEEVKARLLGGEAINDKKKFQFFATPDHLADMLVEMADIQEAHITLEPSAGQGALAIRMRDRSVGCTVVELMPENNVVLKRLKFFPLEADFLTVKPSVLGYFDRIVANPPFTKNQDIDHILHMFDFLKPGGKLVSVASKSWTFGSQKKQVAFREWLESIGAEVTEVPTGMFKSSGTNVASVIVAITKER
jgi:type I restriction-modification system DNA methylase subunit